MIRSGLARFHYQKRFCLSLVIGGGDINRIESHNGDAYDSGLIDCIRGDDQFSKCFPILQHIFCAAF